MFKKEDPNSLTRYYELFENKSKPKRVGYLIADYEVTKYDNVQSSDPQSNNKEVPLEYLLHCTQRIILFNEKGIEIGPSDKLEAYENYPSLIKCSLNVCPKNAEKFLLDYSPQTVNTSVERSGTAGSSNGTTEGSSSSKTIGSSISDTSSYGTKVEVGYNMQTGGYASSSAHAEHSHTTSSSTSITDERNISNMAGSQSSQSTSMSIKDWGAYSLVDPSEQKPKWTFGQEYPWDAIECRQSTGQAQKEQQGKIEVVIPQNMKIRLYDRKFLRPPSHLSRFGINFVMKAVWHVKLSADNSFEPAKIDHQLLLYSANHCVDEAKKDVRVFIDKIPSQLFEKKTGAAPTTELNIPLMGLNVVNAHGSPAVVGFVPNKFLTLPKLASSNSDARLFKFISTSNNLILYDRTSYPKKITKEVGFVALQKGLNAKFTKECPSLTMVMQFKVTDVTHDYALHFMHWKTGGSGVQLSITINGHSDESLEKCVNDTEATGGEKNLLSISLRNQDYASIHYHDHIRLGLNTIEIKMTPKEADFDETGYHLRAIAIE